MPTQVTDEGMARRHTTCVWEVVSAAEGWRGAEIQEAWHRLAGGVATPNGLYRSPEWFEHLHARQPEHRYAVAVGRDAAGRVVGVAPVRCARQDLAFNLGGRRLARVPLEMVSVPGSTPLCPEDEGVYDGFCLALVRAFPHCQGIRIDPVFQGGFLGKYLETSALLKDQFLPYPAGEPRHFSVLPLSGTYDGFMARFNKKKRYNLRRQERVLREQFPDGLSLQQVRSAQDVPPFVRSLRALSVANGQPAMNDDAAYWAQVEGDLVDLAGRGLLRSYCLASGALPLASMRACQYRDTFRVQGTGFHARFGNLSPGTTLFQLVVQDLIESGDVKEVQLGMGDPELSHYASYSYFVTPCASFFVLRKTLRNRACVASHSLLQSCKRWVKARAAASRARRAEAASAATARGGVA
jgi:hypothetical protein